MTVISEAWGRWAELSNRARSFLMREPPAPPTARALFVTLVISLHAIFLAVARI
jgi:hypothetical protein